MSDKFFFTTTYETVSPIEAWEKLHTQATDRQYSLYNWLSGCEGEDPEDDVNTREELDYIEGYLDALDKIKPFIQPREATKMSKQYEQFVSDVLDTIAEMRSTGDFDENTLETLEWRLSPPTAETETAQ